MTLLLLSLAWLAFFLTVLFVTGYFLYRKKLVEFGSRLSLSDLANIVSVLLATFALAFTLATQYQPEPHIAASFRQSLDQNAVEVQLHDGETKEFQVKRGAGRLFFVVAKHRGGAAPASHLHHLRHTCHGSSPMRRRVSPVSPPDGAKRLSV